MKEEQLIVKTQIHFDFWDRLKLLFGRVLQCTVKITYVPEGEPIRNYNGHCEMKFLSKTKSSFNQDSPGYGYTHSPAPPKPTDMRQTFRRQVLGDDVFV